MAMSSRDSMRRQRAHARGSHVFCDVRTCPDGSTGPFGFVDIVKGGDRRESLLALKEVMTNHLEDIEDPRDAAPLSRELRNIMADISALDRGATGPQSSLDELGQRRQERRKEATG